MKNLALLILTPLALAAAPASDAVRDRLLADAAQLGPATLAFDRTIVASQSGGGDKASETRIDRWNGKAWTLLSVNGKPPTPDDIARERKASDVPVPGYYRLAKLFAAAATTTDASGRTVLHAAALPPGSVSANGKDITEHFTADAIVAPGARPFIMQVRLVAREPFRMMLVAKVDSFVTVNDYRLGTHGTPELVRQTTDIDGNMLGKSGLQHNETSFAHH